MSESHDGEHVHPESGEDLSLYARRAQAIEALLVEKSVCSTAEVDQMMNLVESRSPSDGAKVVAHARTDPEFKARLLADPQSALAEIGYSLPDTTPKLAVVENTEQVHHMVVCTLCSCYPRALLGRPPDWYKSFSYRSRAVVDPRGVMREFGLELSNSVEVQVLDSTADLHYLVLPRRPDGTDTLSEAELAKLVSRDSIIGVTNPHVPEGIAAS